MKSIAIKEFGSADQLKELEIEKPSIKDDQVLIEVHAFSINPVDCKRRSGKMGGKLPMVLGGDVAGIVSEIGTNVTNVKPGDRVFANASKTYAEYARSRAEVTVKIPDKLSFVEAAAIPLAGQTAWEALIDKGQLRDNEKVLIHAGAGGVGSLAVQIAKHYKAYVIATASEKNKEFLTSLGVNHVIDYKKEDFEKVVSDVDLVIDPLGGKSQEKSFTVLKKGGRLVSLVQKPDETKLKELGIVGIIFSMTPTSKRLQKLADLLTSGKIKAIVSQTYPFTEEGVREAHEQSETGHTRGKIVIKVK